jgi:hypothetical protein
MADSGSPFIRMGWNSKSRLGGADASRTSGVEESVRTLVGADSRGLGFTPGFLVFLFRISKPHNARISRKGAARLKDPGYPPTTHSFTLLTTDSGASASSSTTPSLYARE